MDFLWAHEPGCREDAQKGLETGESEKHCAVDAPHRLAAWAMKGRESCKELRLDLGSWNAPGGLHVFGLGEMRRPRAHSREPRGFNKPGQLRKGSGAHRADLGAVQKGESPRPGFGLEVGGWCSWGAGRGLLFVEEMVREMEAARGSAVNFKSHKPSVSKPEVALAPR